jgi:lipopolysaccharide export system protein LptA
MWLSLVSVLLGLLLVSASSASSPPAKKRDSSQFVTVNGQQFEVNGRCDKPLSLALTQVGV